ANLYLAMGDLEKGSKLYETIAAKASKAERADLLAELAEDWLLAGDQKRAEGYAKKAFATDQTNSRAAAVLAQAATTTSSSGAADTLAVSDGEPAARGMWHVAENQFSEFA